MGTDEKQQILPGPIARGLHILLSFSVLLLLAGRRNHVTSGRGTPVTLQTSTTVSPSWTVMSSLDSSSMICAGTGKIKVRFDFITGNVSVIPT